MKHCNNPSCPFALTHRRASEYRDEVETCLDCGEPLVPGDAPLLTDPRGPIGLGLWVRLLATVALPGVVALLHLIPLPGYDEILDHFGVDGSPRLSLVPLGVMPFLSASVLVELAAVIVPRWRKLRTSGLQGRRHLVGASLVVTLALTAVQCWYIQTWLADVAYSAGMNAPLTYLPLWAIASAGTFLVVGLALWADRVTLTHGLALILLLEVGYAIGDVVQVAQTNPTTVVQILVLATGIVGLIVLTCWVLTRRPTARPVIGRPGVSLRLPACGDAPFASTSFVLILVVWIEMPYFDPGFLNFAWLVGVPAGTTSVAVSALVVVAFAVLWAWLFNRLGPLRRMLSRASGLAADAPEVRRAAKHLLLGGIWRSATFLLGILAIASIVNDITYLPQVILIVAATALVLDIRDEWRARREHGGLVAVWSLSRLYAVDVALEGLQAVDVPTHVRGVHLRSLMQFFGPYLPLVVLVPTRQEKIARGALEGLVDAP